MATGRRRGAAAGGSPFEKPTTSGTRGAAMGAIGRHAVDLLVFNSQKNLRMSSGGIEANASKTFSSKNAKNTTHIARGKTCFKLLAKNVHNSSNEEFNAVCNGKRSLALV